ncbi:adenosylmethionine--8-amino-7-oxononanoate transaminase [Cytophagales bacterium LB-30]|uniref:Adenosylmethionine-8-amino-7-oxononanoate aminotransferase n=1 Tax=Shiella aurantiaca TaxID=3058365 RepID=A0ABT8F4Q4_9BACT|nr:adenosylmethionine--8-amino-7-oxononanoate transaminase [Shiella aurantiaca]MDN4165435.1 adenosylmethionine--8-amino-7-oxononanoate transaminase [Shiella aurantiaca]
MSTILDNDKEYIWHPFTPLKGMPDPLPIVKAEGAYLYTESGQKILDAVSSWWVNLHGHAHPNIVKAIAEQAATLEHVIFAGFTHKPATELAKKLVSIFPEGIKKVFYSDNGSTSVEVALKMAIQYWFNKGIEKKRIIAFEGAYHGDTFGSMSVGDRSVFSMPFQPYLFEVTFLPFPTIDNREEVINLLSQTLEKGDVAACIYEPLVQGASGMRIYPQEILDEVIHLAKQHQALCIADEVMTGFGRTGKLFASEYLSLPPDIICVSKGITGGFLPLGVTACSVEIIHAFDTADTLKTFYHGHSYTANPIACAAALASFDLLVSEETQSKIQEIADSHRNWAETVKNHPKVVKVECLGTILVIEINTGEGSSYFSEIRTKIYPYFLSKNILLRPLGNTIYCMPPYCITKEELNTIYSEINAFLATLH